MDLSESPCRFFRLRSLAQQRDIPYGREYNDSVDGNDFPAPRRNTLRFIEHNGTLPQITSREPKALQLSEVEHRHILRVGFSGDTRGGDACKHAKRNLRSLFSVTAGLQYAAAECSSLGHHAPESEERETARVFYESDAAGRRDKKTLLILKVHQHEHHCLGGKRGERMVFLRECEIVDSDAIKNASSLRAR